MAIGANFDAQHVALNCGTGRKIVAASAVHSDVVIIGMNTGFHGTPFLSRPVCAMVRGLKSGVARSRGTSDYKAEGEFRQTEVFDAWVRVAVTRPGGLATV